ncbi:RagB/SusD family nutrient uptake outer membrane protein [Chitinophaga cymbidii]|uniref:Membrane protein n=1 Tax=Chitinophaga cymbidii TaxID=1096750 RepID=A0A512RT92_9BACT|nr:RagB/SusD family nutrient uptake outer membrane protein [Chitinophaga cymbidii]GEP98907.1 membrane protein [Chitinophaga cymbidii]
MMFTQYLNRNLFKAACVAGVTLCLASCKEFVTIDPPASAMVQETVFADARTAVAALQETYSRVNNIYTNGNIPGVPLLNALYPDEYRLTTTNNTLRLIYTLSPDSRDISFNGVWSSAYSAIFRANAVLEGVRKYGASIPATAGEQIMGEALFIRAYTYFLLINIYGDVPLLLTTDYERNRRAARTPQDQVYAQIVADLTDARELMQADYLDFLNVSSTMRLRANSGAADALLSRVYLYTGEWESAERHATTVISNTLTYNLEKIPANAFNIGSKETILAFENNLLNYPRIASSFILNSNPNNSTSSSAIGVLSDTLHNSFEPGDNRARDWVGVFTSGASSFHYASKFKVSTTLQQFFPAIRLAEIYLIRAEARMEQNKFELAIDDVNKIRDRARAEATVDVPDPLPELPYGLTKEEIRIAIEKERFTELFIEGHRWFDLKRWRGLNDAAISRAEEAMPAISTAKGATWQPHLIVLPLPQTEIELNTNLVQNLDY